MATLVVLGGGLVKEDGMWRTCREGEGDEYGRTDDWRRVHAAAMLYHGGSFRTLVASGGAGQLEFNKDASIPTVAEVIRHELIELGVADRDIVLEGDSDNTRQQLQNVVTLTQNKLIDGYNLALLGQEWHNPRIWVTANYFPKWRPFYTNVPVIAAEDVLLEHDPDTWRPRIEESRQSPDYIQRMRMEYKGINDILSGRYQSKAE